MQKYYDCPQILRDFLIYHETIKGQSQLTISEYHLDLRMFLRFVKLMRNDMPISTQLEDIPIKDIDVPFLSQITTSDVFDFLSYLANDRAIHPEGGAEYGISPAARARKLSAIKSFFKYLTIFTKNLVAVLIVLTIFCNLVDKEQRQSLDTLIKVLFLFFEV